MRHLAETKTSPLGLNLLCAERGHLVGDGNVVLLLDVANCEDDINLLESAASGLGVCGKARGQFGCLGGGAKKPCGRTEDPDDGDEKNVESSKEGKSSVSDAGEKRRGSHDDSELRKRGKSAVTLDRRQE